MGAGIDKRFKMDVTRPLFGSSSTASYGRAGEGGVGWSVSLNSCLKELENDIPSMVSSVVYCGGQDGGLGVSGSAASAVGEKRTRACIAIAHFSSGRVLGRFEEIRRGGFGSRVLVVCLGLLRVQAEGNKVEVTKYQTCWAISWPFTE